MSSSGVIYAIIVGAWAVYLVPMWLRREDELNRARETQRYAAAIKVLAHKEKFERRWAQPDEAHAQSALPLAAGQGFMPSGRAVKRVVTAGPGAKVRAGAAEPWTPRPEKQGAGASAGNAAKRTAAETVAVAATTAAKPTVTARVRSNAGADARATQATKAAKTTTKAAAAPSNAARTSPSAQSAKSMKYPGPRTGLMARRRRVVGVLFTLTTLGALISADLGAAYLWAMVLPALLLSVYIVRLRSDERVRATAKARRRAAAQLARETREARDEQERDRDRERAQQARDLAGAYARQVDAEAEEEAEALTAQQRRTEAARRRSSAAGRARAQAYTQETPELPRVSNG